MTVNETIEKLQQMIADGEIAFYTAYMYNLDRCLF